MQLTFQIDAANKEEERMVKWRKLTEKSQGQRDNPLRKNGRAFGRRRANMERPLWRAGARVHVSRNRCRRGDGHLQAAHAVREQDTSARRSAPQIELEFGTVRYGEKANSEVGEITECDLWPVFAQRRR